MLDTVVCDVFKSRMHNFDGPPTTLQTEHRTRLHALFNVYRVQHARFQTTPRISQLYSCMHGFQTSWSLIQIFEFNFTLIMTSPSLLHPHSRLLFIIVPLTFSRACMHTHYHSTLSIAHMQSFSSGRSPMKAHTNTHPPLHHIGHSLSLMRACATIDVPLCMCVYS